MFYSFDLGFQLIHKQRLFIWTLYVYKLTYLFTYIIYNNMLDIACYVELFYLF